MFYFVKLLLSEKELALICSNCASFFVKLLFLKSQLASHWTVAKNQPLEQTGFAGPKEDLKIRGAGSNVMGTICHPVPKMDVSFYWIMTKCAKIHFWNSFLVMFYIHINHPFVSNFICTRLTLFSWIVQSRISTSLLKILIITFKLTDLSKAPLPPVPTVLSLQPKKTESTTETKLNPPELNRLAKTKQMRLWGRY